MELPRKRSNIANEDIFHEEFLNNDGTRYDDTDDHMADEDLTQHPMQQQQQQQHRKRSKRNQNFVRRSLNSIADFYYSIEGLFLYEIPYYYHEKETLSVSIITALLNAILLMCILLNPYKPYWTYGVITVLSLLSLNNAVAFFMASKSYQLIHGIQKKDQLLQSLNSHWDGDQPYLIPNVALVGSNKSIREKQLDAPVPIESEDGVLDHLGEDFEDEEENDGSSSSPLLHIVGPLLIQSLVWLFHFLTCSLLKKRERVHIGSSSSLMNDHSTVGQSNDRHPSMMNGNSSNRIRSLELSVWSYSLLQKNLFCFFSPLQVLLCTYCLFFNYSWTNSIVIMSACMSLGAMTHFILGKFEQKESHQRLINFEAMYEQQLTMNKPKTESKYSPPAAPSIAVQQQAQPHHRVNVGMPRRATLTAPVFSSAIAQPSPLQHASAPQLEEASVLTAQDTRAPTPLYYLKQQYEQKRRESWREARVNESLDELNRQAESRMSEISTGSSTSTTNQNRPTQRLSTTTTPASEPVPVSRISSINEEEAPQLVHIPGTSNTRISTLLQNVIQPSTTNNSGLPLREDQTVGKTEETAKTKKNIFQKSKRSKK